MAFPWLFRGPHLGQILHVLALEKSSEKYCFVMGWYVEAMSVLGPFSAATS